MRNKRIIECSIGLLITAIFGVLLTGFLHAGIPHRAMSEKGISLTGRITDSMCGAKHMLAGDGARCVRACMKRGSHYALLSGSKVYSLAGHDEELEKHADQVVTLSGTAEDGDTIRIAALRPETGGNSSGGNSAPSSTDAAGTTEPSLSTIKGLVRDVACPIQNKAAAARTFNLKCAVECVRAGSPIVIQSENGILYFPISSSMPDEDQHPKLAPFVGKYVEAHGQVFERHGTRAIAIQNIRELKEIPLVTDAE